MNIKHLLDQYAAYTEWANARFLDRLAGEDEATLDRPVKSSFPTLRTTMLHIRDAECAWLHRLLGSPAVPWPAEQSQALSTWPVHTKALCMYVFDASEALLSLPTAYHDLRGNRHEQPRWEMLLHCFNHGTYHRGQLITMMRELGMDHLPPTDLVVFQRTLR